jgi:hypothetical protein
MTSHPTDEPEVGVTFHASKGVCGLVITCSLETVEGG